MTSNTKSLIVMLIISVLMVGLSIAVGALTSWHWAAFVAMGIALAACLFFVISLILNAKTEKKGKEKKNPDDERRD